MTEKLVKWFVFSVVIALLLILFNFLLLLTANAPAGLAQLVGHGELLLIAAGLAARAIGDVIGSGDVRKIPKLIASGAAVIVLVLASFYFSHVAASYALNQTVNIDVVFFVSVWLYVISFGPVSRAIEPPSGNKFPNSVFYLV